MSSYGYTYVLGAVVALKLAVLICWICKRTQTQDDTRRRTIIVRQTPAGQQLSNGVNNANICNSHECEWQGPYPQVAPAGVKVVTDPQMEQPPGYNETVVSSDVTVVTDPNIGQPPTYQEAVSGVQGPKY